MCSKTFGLDFLFDGSKKLFVLIDPEEENDLEVLDQKMQWIKTADVDGILLGGSTLKQDFSQDIFRLAHKYEVAPIIGFPGGANQVFQDLDALLFTSLITSDNPQFLIGEQRKAARQIKEIGLPVIPCGYMLLEGGSNSSTTEKVSGSTPVSCPEFALETAIAGQLLGLKSLYLEAGSGALTTVPDEWILKIKEETELPLFVGGGIRSISQIQAKWKAGADVVVIGTIVEDDPSFLLTLKDIYQF